MTTIATLTSATDSSNRGSLRLLEKGQPIDITTADKFVIQLDNGVVIDSEVYSKVFEWGDGPIGVLWLFLGFADIGYGTQVYNAKLFLYDPLHYLGLYWGDFRIRKVKNITSY